MNIITREIEVNAIFDEQDLRSLYTALNLTLSGGGEFRDGDRERLEVIRSQIRRISIEIYGNKIWYDK